VAKPPARLWLRCPCEANLASVTYQANDPDSNGTGLMVRTRRVAGLNARVHRDPPEALAPADAERAFVRLLARASVSLRPRRRRGRRASPGNYHVRYEWWHPCDEQNTAHCVVTLDEICELWADHAGWWPQAPPPPGWTPAPRGSVARVKFVPAALSSDTQSD
jgi:hypothetical protein